MSILNMLNAGMRASTKSYKDIILDLHNRGVDTVTDELNAEVKKRFKSKAGWNEFALKSFGIKDAGASFRRAKSDFLHAVAEGLPIVDAEGNVVLTQQAVVESKTPPEGGAEEPTEPTEPSEPSEPSEPVDPSDALAALAIEANSIIASVKGKKAQDALRAELLALLA